MAPLACWIAHHDALVAALHVASAHVASTQRMLVECRHIVKDAMGRAMRRGAVAGTHALKADVTQEHGSRHLALGRVWHVPKAA